MIVEQPGRVLDALRRGFPEWKRTTLEQRLRAGCVLLNGAVVVRNEPVTVGDVLEVVGKAAARPPPRGPAGLPLLHVDEHLVAVDKPAGLLSVGTAREKERTALHRLAVALGRSDRPARLWPVHRLDRETSGVLLFARSREGKDAVQVDWPRARKTYLAIVDGAPADAEGTIDAPLSEDEATGAHVDRGPAGKPARSRWRVRERRGRTSLLEVALDTGRRHQIRVHLASVGLPVLGDPRYGPPGPRMGLHAWRLSVVHPVDGREIGFEAPPPTDFLALLR